MAELPALRSRPITSIMLTMSKHAPRPASEVKPCLAEWTLPQPYLTPGELDLDRMESDWRRIPGRDAAACSVLHQEIPVERREVRRLSLVCCLVTATQSALG